MVERGFLQKLNSPIQSRSPQPQLRNDDSCLLLLHVGSSQGLPLKAERNWAQNSSPYIREINKQMGMAGIPWRQLSIPIWSLNLISYNTKQKRRNVKTVPSHAAKNIFSRWGIKKISLMRANYPQPYLFALFSFVRCLKSTHFNPYCDLPIINAWWGKKFATKSNVPTCCLHMYISIFNAWWSLVRLKQ